MIALAATPANASWNVASAHRSNRLTVSDPGKVTQARQSFGYTWVLSAFQQPVTTAPGLTAAPGITPYDPAHPPDPF